jgi:isopentenyl phosphate kinase
MPQCCRKLVWVLYALAVVSHATVCYSEEQQSSPEATTCFSPSSSFADHDVVLVKIGGSSITNKAQKETLNQEALDWFAEAVRPVLSRNFCAPSGSDDIDTGRIHNIESALAKGRPIAFVVVHGAGSFGHHQAKEFGLQGQTAAAPTAAAVDEKQRRFAMQGLATTRLSVLHLNHYVVSSLLANGINAIGISPCFSNRHMEADGRDTVAQEELIQSVEASLKAGLVPVLHGDACLYGRDGAGILSGDTVVEILAKAPWISRVLFLTDVDGVFDKDPRMYSDANLLRSIQVDAKTGSIVGVKVDASGSSHEQDTTGGLKTKLASAVAVVNLGLNVTIARCGSTSARQAIQSIADIERATILFR